MILFKQMTILFVIMIIGFICRKKKILNDEGSRVISGIVVNVANPALILSASINKETVIEGRNLVMVSILSVSVYIALILFSSILVRALRLKKKEYGTFMVMTVFSNIGFMGFPLISAVYGSEALLYASFFVIPYNVLIYTWGIMAMRKKDEKEGTDEKNLKEGNGTSGILAKDKFGRVFNIGVIACIITIIIYLSRIRVPAIVENVITSLSALTAPLSMIVIGDSFSKINIRSLLSDGQIILFSIIKQMLIPIVGVFVLKLCGLDNMMMAVCMVMLATPVGSMTAMLAQQYDGEYELASKGIALTTVLSVVTMPLVSTITGV